MDIYGQHVKMNIGGEATYATCPGLLLTIAVFLLVGAFAAFRAVQIAQMENTSHLQRELKNDLSVDDVFGFDKTRFAIAFGFVDVRMRPER